MHVVNCGELCACGYFMCCQCLCHDHDTDFVMASMVGAKIKLLFLFHSTYVCRH